jgi:isopentenyl-diphosphate delta-isomerase
MESVMEESVILVNENDEVVGIGEKLRTHLEGKLHRAFSLLIFNSRGDLLLQKRAETKYHSGNLWSNTCCGHPRPGESIETAAHRRLKEEMGFDCGLEKKFSFIYRARLDGSSIEHEFDHVLVGSFDGEPRVNRAEAADWKWVDVETLRSDLEKNPSRYTYWLRVILSRI